MDDCAGDVKRHHVLRNKADIRLSDLLELLSMSIARGNRVPLKGLLEGMQDVLPYFFISHEQT